MTRTALALMIAGLLPCAAHAADAIELTGKGVQIYRCTAAGHAYAWQLTAPDAVLLDADGRTVGHHFAGPSWQLQDGSTLVGAVMAASASPTGSIPWLLLRARSHSGAGRLADIGYVTRTRTVGGVMPAYGCDQAHNGAEARVDYSASYTFLSDKAP